MVDGFYGEHSLFGKLAARHRGHHLLITFQGLLVLVHVAVNHTHAYGSLGLVNLVRGILPEVGETADGVIVIPKIGLGTSELIIGLGVQRG